eukprot:CAMPEP_0178399470 /NCGR_PEP_ID=MMETSP0689_2-20121128/15297_1 /TAXON_ID=160604 /ORGANISM="Amphidinium massartii, Strain CS-259" /LENGTH=394 /DNA_ID=CAMNT_0020020249 /DNA_START=87 /DNA_END=1272 /DNA_ORIENTATION=-
MPLYEEKFICPFAIRFSQARIRPTFQDGRAVEKSKDQIRKVPWPLADGDYDILLDAPFPPIEIMRWRPKYRSEDGSAFETGRGDAVLADSCWCTFDNRRLYCLQAAAVEAWPRRAAAVVHIMHNLPEGRSVLRKFRSTDLGVSVKISRRNDTIPRSVWHWPDLAPGALAPSSAEERRAVDRAALDAAKESWEELVDVPSGSVPSRAHQAMSALERFEQAEYAAAELDCAEDSTTVTTTASGSGSPAVANQAFWPEEARVRASVPYSSPQQAPVPALVPAPAPALISARSQCSSSSSASVQMPAAAPPAAPRGQGLGLGLASSAPVAARPVGAAAGNVGLGVFVPAEPTAEAEDEEEVVNSNDASSASCSPRLSHRTTIHSAMVKCELDAMGCLC